MTLTPAAVQWFSLGPFALERDDLPPQSEDLAGSAKITHELTFVTTRTWIRPDGFSGQPCWFQD
jgi:hypothetical protein